ncbi:MAG TPA: substrate-binding domain-containing protein, partial [Candidatus Limnocylindrales bacterium]
MAAIAAFAGAQPAVALSYTSIAGEGSSWAGQAWVDWIAQAANEGVTVTYNPNGSSVGRTHFAQQNNAVFADSEIPFTGDASDPADDTLPGFSYGMLPIVAGGTAFMYNLPVNGTRYTKLKLTMDDIAGIFSGRITNWNQLQADNPGVA